VLVQQRGAMMMVEGKEATRASATSGNGGSMKVAEIVAEVVSAAGDDDGEADVGVGCGWGWPWETRRDGVGGGRG